MTRTIATLAFAVTAAIAFAGKHNACNHGHGHVRGKRAEVKVPESAQRMMGLRTVAARKQ